MTRCEHMLQLQIDKKRQDILTVNGNLLIMGGPGSGKTTIALFKAKQIVESGVLRREQKILFLSFARATISRIEENIGAIISMEVKKQIEINTYHGFIWNILKHHGYLLTTNPLRILPPHETSRYLFNVNKHDRLEKLYQLFLEKGLIHFDVFARICTELFCQSNSLKNIISKMYPIVILDEFQDTNLDEWEFIRTLGTTCQLIALADPGQRIYDFRGADPKRIPQFIEQCQPTVFDFGNENNRSNGTDIVQFGNDLLSQTNVGKAYQNVTIKTYPYRKPLQTHWYLKSTVLESMKRLRKSGISEWSVGVLVPTNTLMLEVSDVLQKKQHLTDGREYPSIQHDVAIDMVGPSLAALFLAVLLEKGSQHNCNVKDIVQSLINYILGRHGTDSPTKSDTKIVSGLEEFLATGKAIGKTRKKVINDCNELVQMVNTYEFSGNIVVDWKEIAGAIGKCQSMWIQKLSYEVGFVRLLQRGSQLYSALDNIWRNSYTYAGAASAVSDALTQEHFSLSTRKWSGVNVMTIHRAKGKEFDEVIVYEGQYQNRIVSNSERIDQARLNLRVAVTRAKRKATILTPDKDQCPLV